MSDTIATILPFSGVIDIIGVDPGGKTGLAHYLTSILEDDQAWFTSLEGNPDVTLNYVRTYTTRYPSTFVVYERFIPRRGVHTHQPEAPQTVGALLNLAREIGFACQPQNVAEAKFLAPNQTLRDFGFWKSGGGGHHNDAARHVVFGIHRLFPYEMSRMRKGDRMITRVD